MSYRPSLILATITILVGCGRGPAAESPVSAGSDNPGGTAAVVEAVEEEPLPNLWKRESGGDWPAFLGPTGDSKSPETGILKDWSRDKLRIVWQRELGNSYGIGAVSQGRYFQFDRIDDQAVVVCLNAETGEELWQFGYRSNYRDLLGYNNGPRCSPVVDGNRVYVYGAEGMLHCLRASDGELVWKIDTTSKFGVVQNFFGVGSTPVVEEGMLLCMVGGSPPGSPGLYQSNGRVEGNGSGIVALNKYTGQIIYQITDELASYASLKTATVAGRCWCFAFCRGGLVGFEPASGKVDLHYPWRATLLESVNASMPVVVGDEVFISETYQVGSSLLKVRPGDYEVVWKDDPRKREKSMKTHWNTPIYVDGYLYGCSGRNAPDADLRCIDWKSGEVQWIEQAPLSVRERSSLLLVDGHFVCLGELGTLKLFKADPRKCELVTEIDLRAEGSAPETSDSGPSRLLEYPCWAAPILAHGLLYVRGNDRLLCLDLIPQE